jgi:hypothetical protein
LALEITGNQKDYIICIASFIEVLMQFPKKYKRIKEKYSTAHICRTLELKSAKIKLTLQAMGNNMV